MNQALQVDFPFEMTVPAASAVAARLTAWTPADWPLAQGWRAVVDDFLGSEPGRRLGAFIGGRLSSGAVIYPPQPLRALALTPLADVRVVILGQDPYHGPGQAEGLAFSVAPGLKLPPSLRNIFKELQRDLGLPLPSSGSLVRWAQQGVLLLNTSLTVEDGQPAGHAKQGWEALTDEIIKTVAQKTDSVVFLLWGAHAQTKRSLVAGGDTPTGVGAPHLVLTANHPSPLAALRPPQPFIGCGHFGLANAFLQRLGRPPVAW